MNQELDTKLREELALIAAELDVEFILNGSWGNNPGLIVRGNENKGTISILYLGDGVKFQQAVEDTKNLLEAYEYKVGIKEEPGGFDIKKNVAIKYTAVIEYVFP